MVTSVWTFGCVVSNAPEMIVDVTFRLAIVSSRAFMQGFFTAFGVIALLAACLMARFRAADGAFFREPLAINAQCFDARLRGNTKIVKNECAMRAKSKKIKRNERNDNYLCSFHSFCLCDLEQYHSRRTKMFERVSS